jgi:hypothetical protein
VPPVFRITPATGNSRLDPSAVSITTIRPNGAHQTFELANRVGYLECGALVEPSHPLIFRNQTRPYLNRSSVPGPAVLAET